MRPFPSALRSRPYRHSLRESGPRSQAVRLRPQMFRVQTDLRSESCSTLPDYQTRWQPRRHPLLRPGAASLMSWCSSVW